MPDRNFSRTGSADSGRKFGEAPILGRVSRTPVSAVEPRGKRRRQMRKKARVNFAVVAWTLLVSLVVLMLLVVFLVGYFRNKSAAAAEASTFRESAERSAVAITEQKSLELPSIGEVEALAIVRYAFAAGDAQELTRHFLLKNGTSPGEAMAALDAITAKEGGIATYRWMGGNFANGMAIGEVATQRETDGKYTNRVAQLRVCADGEWRIDLDSYLRKSVPDWPEILSRKVHTSMVRIFVAADTYYNGIYSDDQEWQGYVLVSPDMDEPLYGYARRGSSQEKALRKILDSEGKNHRATVEISAHPEAGRRQFEITGVIAENWVIGETRFDESF